MGSIIVEISRSVNLCRAKKVSVEAENGSNDAAMVITAEMTGRRGKAEKWDR